MIVVGCARLPARTPNDSAPFISAVGSRSTVVLRACAVLLLVAIVLPAAFGAEDVASNPAPRLLFTVGWAGLLLLSWLTGPLWPRANPLRWAAPEDADPAGQRGLWPAVAGLAVFATAEQVLEPSPLLVLIIVAAYVMGTATAVTMWGASWFSTGDPFDRASYLLGRLTPLGRAGGRVRRRSVRAGVAATPVQPGTAAFLGVLIATSAYDAAAPGGAFGLRLALFALALVLGGGALVAASRPAYLAAAFLPVAAVHVAAHYLAPLLVDTQIAVVQASDPFGVGWDLFGLTGTEIVAEPISPLVGRTISYVLLVAGHALAMVVAKDLAAARVAPRALSATLFPIRAVILLSLTAGVYLGLGGA